MGRLNKEMCNANHKTNLHSLLNKFDYFLFVYCSCNKKYYLVNKRGKKRHLGKIKRTKNYYKFIDCPRKFFIFLFCAIL